MQLIGLDHSVVKKRKNIEVEKPAAVPVPASVSEFRKEGNLTEQSC